MSALLLFNECISQLQRYDNCICMYCKCIVYTYFSCRADENEI